MNSGGWFEEQQEVLSDINITPLVDVSLVLLIIFMITAPMMVQGADVNLPRTQRMNSLDQSQIIVTVRADGEVLLNGEAVGIDGLEPRLSPLATPGRSVLFHGDEAVNYGVVMEVMAILQRLEVDIGLVTEPIPQTR